MGRVLTNNVNLSYAIETAVGVAGTSWFLLEPNSINSFGASISTVARAPISKNKQRRKGTITDLDSAAEFEHDITLSVFQDFIEGFCFATATNSDMDLAVSAVGATADEYTVSAVSASVADRLQFSATEYATLVFGRGFSNASNNGLKQLDADVATAATAIGVTAALEDETPTGISRLELAGLRLLNASTDFAVAYSSVTKKLTITEQGTIVGFDWADFGLTVGQMVYIGSPDGAGGVQNALQNSAADDAYGYGRVISIAAQVLTLDKVDTKLQVAAPTSDATVDILFGKYVRNVSIDSADYLERSFQFEAEYPNLMAGGDSGFQYSLGNYCNTVSFNLPLTDKATATFSFIGTDTDSPVGPADRKTGASAAKSPVQTSAFNTTADIARLRVTEADEDGLSTDFKSLTFSINNNVSPEKVLGVLGARYMNTGNFEVDIEAQLLFTNADVLQKIRDNETVTMDFIIQNDDGSIAVDVPSMTLGGGDREFPANESLLVNLTAQAFGDAVLGTSLGVSIFPVTP